MADIAAIAGRAHPLAGRSAAGGGVSVNPAPAARRLSLRCAPSAVAALSDALGVKLPRRPKKSAVSGARLALWLGPDEWLIVDEAADPAAALAGIEAPHSAVDVSHRNTAIMVTGVSAAELIAHGCPHNVSLEAFPVGACSRTVFGKAEIVLYRPAAETFRIEVWRSFSDYVFAYLADAARDLGWPGAQLRPV